MFLKQTPEKQKISFNSKLPVKTIRNFFKHFVHHSFLQKKPDRWAIAF